MPLGIHLHEQLPEQVLKFPYTAYLDKGGEYHPKKTTILIDGLSANDHITRIIAASHTFYEHDLLLHLALKGPRGGLFVDVGANIGNHSIYFAKFLADHVVSIEPSAELRGVLGRNLAMNHVDNVVTVCPCAAGAETGFGRVVLPDGSHDNSGETRVVVSTPAGDETATNGVHDCDVVPIEPIDRIVGELEDKVGDMPTRMIKIDAEGVELDVLKGARGVLRQQRPQLIVEAKTGCEQAEISGFLADFGYEAVGQFCDTPTFHYIDRSVHHLRREPLRCQAARRLAKLPRLPGKIMRMLGPRHVVQ